jgi:hypothetical protein
MRRRQGCCFLALIIFLCGVAGGGCSAQRRGAAQPTSASNERSLSQGARQRAVAVYVGMWQAFVVAGVTANADDPNLARYAAGDALRAITTALANDRRSGRVTKGSVETHPVVSGAAPASDPTQVLIQDCLDATAWLEHQASGALADQQPGGKHRVTATVSKLSNGWRVTAFAAQGVGTC